MNSIYHRVSVRKYQDKPVEKEKIEALLRAAMQAPSAGYLKCRLVENYKALPCSFRHFEVAIPSRTYTQGQKVLQGLARAEL